MKSDLKSSPFPFVDPSIYLSFKWLTLAATLLPAAGIYFCVAYTFVFQSDVVSNFSMSNCPHVKSSVPPISYSIGVWEPQKLIWMMILFVHVPPRMLIAILFPKIWPPGSGQRWLNVFMYLEVTGLVCVTVFDVHSIFGFHFHASLFVVWATGSIGSMSISVHLMRIIGVKDRQKLYARTFILKLILLILYVFGTTSATILWPLSQENCKLWAYVIFCLFEYSLVGLNAMFWFVNLYELMQIYSGFRVIAIRKDENPSPKSTSTILLEA